MTGPSVVNTSPRIPDKIDIKNGSNPFVPAELDAEWHSRDLPHEEVIEKYPFILSTGHRRCTSFHSEHRQIAILREIDQNPMLEMNPADAAKLNITDGQWVRIENMYGQAKYKVRIMPTIKEGHVEAEHGWWFPEQDGSEPNLFGVWQSNCNTLIPVHHNNALGFGAPYKSACCNVVTCYLGSTCFACVPLVLAGRTCPFALLSLQFERSS